MATTPETVEYVLLPQGGLRATGAANAEARAFLEGADRAAGRAAMSLDGRDVPFRVVDSIGPDGAKPPRTRLPLLSAPTRATSSPSSRTWGLRST